MSIIHEFKSIRSKLERLEQKAEYEEKNPKVDPNKVVWSPEWGYGVPVPFCWRRVNNRAVEYAIAQGSCGDEFVKLPNGTFLSRPLTS